jgi:DNA polymerase-3 subunit epsilon
MIPNKRPAPRKEELEILRNPSGNGKEVNAVNLKNPMIAQRIAESKKIQNLQPKTSVYKELVKILAACSFQEVMENENFSGEFAYLEKVIEFLADGILTDSEIQELNSLATLYSLDDAQILISHTSLLKAFAIQALKDESISVTEKDELVSLASSLRIDKNSLTSIIRDAKAIRANILSKHVLSLPDNWKLGAPLRVGQKVVFTGCDPNHRAQLESESKKAGVAISSKVSSKTSLLITDGSYEGNKARDARAMGVRVVSPDEYELMLKYIQPTETT